MKSPIITGTSVIDSSDAAAIDKRLRPGERLEEPALLRLEREDREERHGDDQERHEERRPHLLRRFDDELPVRPSVGPRGRSAPCACGDSPPSRCAASIIAPIAIAIPPRLMMFALNPRHSHREKCHENARAAA